MNAQTMERMVDQAIMDGIIEAECMICGLMIQCEPDARFAFCDNCNTEVKVRNFLIETGFI